MPANNSVFFVFSFIAKNSMRSFSGGHDTSGEEIDREKN